MTTNGKPRILVVDDEEAILETMTFTFQDDYQVLTAADARRGLELLEKHQPVAAVLTDQRMPHMSGIEFVSEVWKRWPQTVRMLLTGFSDQDAIIQAINDGHVYAYVTKPWEPDQLKQLMKQAVEHHKLAMENERLLRDLQRANVFLGAVMDELDTGAIAVDAAGTIQAVNRPMRDAVGFERDPMGRSLEAAFREVGLGVLAEAALRLAEEEGEGSCEIDAPKGERTHRLRIRVEALEDASGQPLGRVFFFREISHEPLVRRYEEIVDGIVGAEGELRELLERAREQLGEIAGQVGGSPVHSPGMQFLADRLSRARTAVENWLDVDDALAREEFPDAQVLQDRLRVALSRWPRRDELPARIRELARRVEDYYESGENPRARIL